MSVVGYTPDRTVEATIFICTPSGPKYLQQFRSHKKSS